jgi:hypothetical protein
MCAAIPLTLIVVEYNNQLVSRRNCLLVMRWCVCCAIGFLLVYGYWGWALFQEFGNPFFPLFNGFFQSPDYPAYSFSHERFKPHSLLDFLMRPLSMIDAARYVHTETVAPDLRPLALLLCAPLSIIFLRSADRVADKGEFAVDSKPAFRRNQRGLLAYVSCTWVIWLLSTGNGRYAIPLFLVIGLLLAEFLWTMSEQVFGLVIAIAVVLVQVVLVFDNSTARWTAYPEAPQFLRLDVPQHLRDKPSVLLSVDPQSASFLAAFVHPESRMANVVGSVPIDANGPGGARVKQMLQNDLPVYALTAIPFLREDNERPQGTPPLTRINHELGPCGVQLARDRECSVIRILDAARGIVTMTDVKGVDTRMSGNRGWWICPLERHPAATESSPAIEMAKRALTAIEQRCPGQFQPGGVATVNEGDALRRSYVNTDSHLRVNIEAPNEPVIAALFGHKLFGFPRVTDIVENRQSFSCPDDR